MAPDDLSYATAPGEDKAWAELMAADPATVAANSGASYDPATGLYRLAMFGRSHTVDKAKRAVTDELSGRPPETLLNLAAPVYLNSAKPVPPSGRLVKEFTGGEFFYRGAHTLPLDELAARYGDDRSGFSENCRFELGGTPAKLGDAAYSFLVFPRVSMTLALWLGDDEFPARVSLLFDSNCHLHIPLDIVWAVALAACERLLQPSR